MTTSARDDRITGTKTWISNGGIADFYTVFARAPEGITAYVVDAEHVEIAERIDVIAPHPLARIEFHDAPAVRIGEPGKGMRVALATLDVFRSTVGAAALGMARRALDEALARVRAREMFGSPMAELPLVQAKLADMALGVDASALLVYRAAWTKDDGGGARDARGGDGQAPRHRDRAARDRRCGPALRRARRAQRLGGRGSVSRDPRAAHLRGRIRGSAACHRQGGLEMRFVLVHGSWHHGGLWKPVADHLESAGHLVTTPTVAGHGKEAAKDVSHDDCVQSIVDHIVESDLSDIVLVGHSFGGTVIARVAGEIPERIRRLVFWNAFVPLDGNCLNDECPPHYVELFDSIAAASGDNTVMLPWPIWREAFINDADEALAKLSYEALSPEPYRCFTDKLDLGAFYKTTMPRSYLNCTEDTAMPHGEYAWHPRFSSRLGLARIVQMPGSHEVMFTNPSGLAAKFVEAGRD